MMSCSYLNAGGVKPEPCWVPPYPLPDPHAPRGQPFYRPPHRAEPGGHGPVDLAGSMPTSLAAGVPANLAARSSGNLAAGTSGSLASSVSVNLPAGVPAVLPAPMPALDLSTTLKPGAPSSDEDSE